MSKIEIGNTQGNCIELGAEHTPGRFGIGASLEINRVKSEDHAFSYNWVIEVEINIAWYALWVLASIV